MNTICFLALHTRGFRSNGLKLKSFVNHEKDVSFVYNRKEKKEHGRGQIVGPSLAGKIVIADDVITGTAIKEASK